MGDELGVIEGIGVGSLVGSGSSKTGSKTDGTVHLEGALLGAEDNVGRSVPAGVGESVGVDDGSVEPASCPSTRPASSNHSWVGT